MIEVEKLTVKVGSFALRDVSFFVPAGRYAVIMGRTGSGKTTLLEAICGLKPVASGTIWLHGRVVTWRPPGEREVGYVPQDLALFPTMSVYDHLAFALWMRRCPALEIKRRVHELADLLGIGHLLGRKPRGLSGGEAQRVALGRALSYRPRVLLLDEPLSALDDDTRQEMYELLRQVQRETGVTTLHITHSRTEAEVLADVLLLLEGGAVQQAGRIRSGELSQALKRPGP